MSALTFAVDAPRLPRSFRINERARPAAAPAAAKVCCARCGVAQGNSSRDFYPLWFITEEGVPLCPKCVGGQVLSANVTQVNAQALLPTPDPPLPPRAGWKRA